MAKRRDAKQAIIDAALDLAAIQGWRHTTIGDIAGHAKVSLAEFHEHFAGKTDVLAAFLFRVDRDMLEGLEVDTLEESARDRLFEVVMRRFDVLRPHKDGVRAILRDLPRDPPAAACLAYGPFQRSLRWMLTGAGLEPSGLSGLVRLDGLAAIYLAVMRVWVDDDSADMARTMAALDRRLRRAETIMSLISGRPRRARPPAAPEPPEAPPRGRRATPEAA